MDKSDVQNSCTEAVFERCQEYRNEGRIQRLERFDDAVTAKVHGSELYDVVVEINDDGIEAR